MMKILGLEFGRKAMTDQAPAGLINQFAQAMYRFIGYNQPIWVGDNFEEYVKNGYQFNADLYAIISYRANMAQKLSIGLKIDGEEVESHPALDILKSPNPASTLDDIIESFFIWYALSGNFYLYKARVGDRAPVQLYAMPPAHTEILAGTWQEPVKGFRIRNWFNDDMPAKDVIHVRSFNPSQSPSTGEGLYGQSPLMAARRTLTQNNDAVESNTAAFKNQGIQGMLVGDKEGDLSSDEAGQIQRSLEQKFGGAYNKGKFSVTSANLRWLQMGLKPVDLDILSSLGYTMRQLCSIYHFPSKLINDEGSSGTYNNNVKEFKRRAYEDSILPVFEKLVHKLNCDLLPEFIDTSKVDAEYFMDTSEVQALNADKKEVVEWMTKSESFTKNEIREALGYGFSENPLMDEVYVSSSQTPLNLSAEEFPEDENEDS